MCNTNQKINTADENFLFMLMAHQVKGVRQRRLMNVLSSITPIFDGVLSMSTLVLSDYFIKISYILFLMTCLTRDLLQP